MLFSWSSAGRWKVLTGSCSAPLSLSAQGSEAAEVASALPVPGPTVSSWAAQFPLGICERGSPAVGVHGKCMGRAAGSVFGGQQHSVSALLLVYLSGCWAPAPSALICKGRIRSLALRGWCEGGKNQPGCQGIEVSLPCPSQPDSSPQPGVCTHLHAHMHTGAPQPLGCCSCHCAACLPFPNLFPP